MKILFRTFLYSSTRSTSIIFVHTFFLNSDFLAKTNEKDHSFCNTVSLKKPVPASMFLFDVRKNICTAPFLDAQELHSWSILKANVCIFLYKSARKFLFNRHIFIYRHTSILPSIASNCWNFPDKLDFKSKSLAKFILRSLSLNIK